MEPGKLIRWERRQSAEMEVGGRRLTLESRALSVETPFGGFVWNRPTAVGVAGPQGVERIPVRDITRRAQLGMVAGVAAALIGVRLFSRGGKL